MKFFRISRSAIINTACLKKINTKQLQCLLVNDQTEFRVDISREKINELIEIMKKDEIAPKEKVVQLREEIHQYLKDNNFKSCETMGDIVEAVLNFTLRNYETSVTGK